MSETMLVGWETVFPLLQASFPLLQASFPLLQASFPLLQAFPKGEASPGGRVRRSVGLEECAMSCKITQVTISQRMGRLFHRDKGESRVFLCGGSRSVEQSSSIVPKSGKVWTPTTLTHLAVIHIFFSRCGSHSGGSGVTGVRCMHGGSVTERKRKSDELQEKNGTSYSSEG